MKPAVVARILGLATGAALIGVGAVEIGIVRSDYESARVQAFCAAGLCADQFSVSRVFELGQKATLGNPSGELEDFKRAVLLSPASAYRWADLAEAEFNVRDERQARYAVSQALKAAPKSGVILMRAANLFFQIGDSQEVIRQLGVLLRDPWLADYYDTAFLTYSRLGLPIDQILEQGVPPRKDVFSGLLTFWTKINKVDEAVATWRWANERSLADGQSTGDFFAFLIRAGRQSLAQQLWQEYADKLEPGYRKTNWIYNASFESAPQPSPFNWTVSERRDVEAMRVDDVAHGGKWSFRIRFSGETNTAYHQTFQDMVLPPGRYRLSVMMKSDKVTSDEGLRVHIFDPPNQSGINIWMDTLLGTQDWTKVEKTFEVPVGLKLVRIELGRLNSDKFDNKIGGTIWVDELSLSRQ